MKRGVPRVGWLRVWLSAIALACLGLSTIALAQSDDVRVKFSIPAQPAAKSLETYAKQAGVQILFPHDHVASIQTQELSGEFTRGEALSKLLNGTGLKAEYVSKDVVSVRSASGSDSSSSSKPRSRLESTSSIYLAQGQEQTTGARDAKEAAPTGEEGRRSAGESEQRESRAIRQEGIVVTAQKRSELLIDVPQSVSVLTADDLAKIGATQFRDFANTVPGLTFSTTGAGYTQLSMRGVTTGFDIGSTVGIYVDEVPYGTSGAFAQGAQGALDVGLFDMDRIEVLRGPQGTLYGAIAMGGLIKYVTKRPDTTRFAGEAQAGMSSTQDGGFSYNVAGAINAPIVTDTVALRASVFSSRDGGYIDNTASGDKDVNRSNIYGGRLDLLFTPTHALSIRINGFLQNISRPGDGTTDYAFSGEPLYGPLDQRRLFAEPFESRFRLVSGTVSYDLGWAALTSISSYQTGRTGFFLDVPQLVVLCPLQGSTCSAVGEPINVSTDKFAQEVRLASSGGQALEWIVGGFYTHETSERALEFVLRDVAGQQLQNRLLSISTPSRFEEYAAFGDLTYRLTSKFDITGGLRYAQNRQEFTQFGSGILIGSTPTRRSTENVTTYLANARYHFSDRATGYLRYATGYRPGGPNFVANDPATGLPIARDTFDSDKLKSYEAGVKAETSDRRFGIDLAGYYIDWSNIQLLVVRSGFSVFGNASGGATVRGAELSVTARPSPAFSVKGAFGYQDATLKQAQPDLGAAQGERLPNVPRFTAALNADYKMSSGEWRPTVGATVRHVSDRGSSFDNARPRRQYKLPAYTTLDLRTSITFGAVNAQLYIHNVLNERGEMSALWTSFGTARVAIIQPRTVGLTLTSQF